MLKTPMPMAMSRGTTTPTTGQLTKTDISPCAKRECVEVETHHRLHVGVDDLTTDETVGDAVLGEEREKPIEEIGTVERHGPREVSGAHICHALIGGVLLYHGR